MRLSPLPHPYPGAPAEMKCWAAAQVRYPAFGQRHQAAAAELMRLATRQMLCAAADLALGHLRLAAALVICLAVGQDCHLANTQTTCLAAAPVQQTATLLLRLLL